MSYSETITYNSAASLNLGTNAIIHSGALQLGPSGGPYPTGSFVVTTQHVNSISALSSFAESSTLPSSTAIAYQLVLNGIEYWYNASIGSWAVADGTIATTNPASVINSNASTLFSSLALLVPQYLSLRIWLQTGNASNTPVLASNTIGYTWVNGNPGTISLCTVYGYLSDLLGNNPIPTMAQPISLQVSSPYSFMHSTHVVLPFTQRANFDNTGYVSLPIIETATPGVPLNFSLTFYNGLSLVTQELFSAIVPNQPTIQVDSLSSAVPYNFG